MIMGFQEGGGVAVALAVPEGGESVEDGGVCAVAHVHES